MTKRKLFENPELIYFPMKIKVNGKVKWVHNMKEVPAGVPFTVIDHYKFGFTMGEILLLVLLSLATGAAVATTGM